MKSFVFPHATQRGESDVPTSPCDHSCEKGLAGCPPTSIPFHFCLIYPMYLFCHSCLCASRFFGARRRRLAVTTLVTAATQHQHPRRRRKRSSSHRRPKKRSPSRHRPRKRSPSHPPKPERARRDGLRWAEQAGAHLVSGLQALSRSRGCLLGGLTDRERKVVCTTAAV